MFATKLRTPAVAAAAVLTATIVCLSLAGCTVHYNHRGESIPGAIQLRMLHPTILTPVLHGGRR